jgi:NAD(P)-dependent dehydrogenase (short-subunit alcohol dehydrogenase family)
VAPKWTERRGAEATPIQADVTNSDDMVRMFATVRGRFGTLNILVSNTRQK